MDSEGWVVLCLKGQELWPCGTAAEVSSRSAHISPWGIPACGGFVWEELHEMTSEGWYKRPWKESQRVIISNQSFQLEVCPLVVAPPLTLFLSGPAGPGQPKAKFTGWPASACQRPPQHWVCTGVSQDSASSQNYDLKIKLSVEFAEEGKFWDGLWGEMWVPFIYSFLLCHLLEARVYLDCPGNHWAFQKNHLKLDVTEFLKQLLLENTLAVN